MNKKATLVVAAGLCVAGATGGNAGGFSVREQSASLQGASFAGAGAAYDLSSMYWNSAAAGIAGTGITMESHYAAIFPDADISGEGNFTPFPAGFAEGSEETEFGKSAVVAATYATHRLDEKTVLGLAINAPLGLSTKPEDRDFEGSYLGRRSTVFTLNVNPS